LVRKEERKDQNSCMSIKFRQVASACPAEAPGRGSPQLQTSSWILKERNRMNASEWGEPVRGDEKKTGVCVHDEAVQRGNWALLRGFRREQWGE